MRLRSPWRPFRALSRRTFPVHRKRAAIRSVPVPKRSIACANAATARDGDNDGIPCENLCGKTLKQMNDRLEAGL
jgi:hypothetical protein